MGSGKLTSLDIFFQDESRFGLLTIMRKVLTVSGVKPIVPYQHRFQNFYLFGAYSPLTGSHLTLELPRCDAVCFQVYIDEMSRENPHQLRIIILDNGAFHKARWLRIPDNIVLVFLPPYSPELNPAEKIWAHLKGKLANIPFKSLDDLSDRLMDLIKNIKTETIKSITNYESYKQILMPYYSK